MIYVTFEFGTRKYVLVRYKVNVYVNEMSFTVTHLHIFLTIGGAPNCRFVFLVGGFTNSVYVQEVEAMCLCQNTKVYG